MRNLIVLLTIIFSVAQSNAQNDFQDRSNKIEIGEILTINEPSSYSYAHLEFPRPSFIIKKGGIPNYKSVAGTKVEVKDIKTNKDGNTVVVLQRVDGGKFFRNSSTVTANLEKALEKRELIN